MNTPPCQVLPTAPTAGDRFIAIAAETLSTTTTTKGWMWDPFHGKSLKQDNPRCQRLQNAAPPNMESVTFRHTPRVFSPGKRQRR